MLNLFHLKYFFDAARLQSMTAAAAENHLSRPAISQAIRSLEIQLGADLLEHKRREFTLTHEGHWLLSQCEGVFQQVESIRDHIAGQRALASGLLRVGCSRSLAAFLLPDSLQQLGRKHPGLEISLSLGTTREICDSVAQRHIDLGLVLDDGAIHDHRGPTLHRGNFVCVQAKRGKPENRWLLTEPRPETKKFRTTVANKKEFSSWRILEIHSWDLIAQFAAQGLGVGLVPDFLLRTPVGAGLQALPDLSFRSPYEVVLIQRKDTPNNRLFVESLQK
ncbi:MAG: LysR family transcriptional regulator [Bdellovibrionales bacterium]|nr:LysR family transcriptional regulator [Bdellovibrionales bacterium]